MQVISLVLCWALRCKSFTVGPVLVDLGVNSVLLDYVSNHIGTLVVRQLKFQSVGQYSFSPLDFMRKWQQNWIPRFRSRGSTRWRRTRRGWIGGRAQWRCGSRRTWPDRRPGSTASKVIAYFTVHIWFTSAVLETWAMNLLVLFHVPWDKMDSSTLLYCSLSSTMP